MPTKMSATVARDFQDKPDVLAITPPDTNMLEAMETLGKFLAALGFAAVTAAALRHDSGRLISALVDQRGTLGYGVILAMTWGMLAGSMSAVRSFVVALSAVLVLGTANVLIK